MSTKPGQLQRGARALKKGHSVCFRSKAEVFQFIEANRAEFKVTAMCRLYGVTRAGFYAWGSRVRSKRERRNEQLAERIRAVHEASRGTYGSPRIYQALCQQGCRVSENRVARVMREHGIKARVATIRYTNPRLQRFFGAARNERPGLIFHTDRGIEYAAEAFKARLAQLGITQSMNRPGKVTDNAYIESFFHSMKADIVHGLNFTEDREIERAVRVYVPFYNGTRLHSWLNYVPASDVRTADMTNPMSTNSGEHPAAASAIFNRPPCSPRRKPPR